MERLLSIPSELAIALLTGTLLVSGCSGSSDAEAPFSGNEMITSENNSNNPDDGQAVAFPDASPSGDETQAPAPTPTPNSNISFSGTPDQVTPDPINPIADTPITDLNNTGSGSVVSDPLVQNSIRVDFDIEVPAYQSNELQVQVNWGEKIIFANWVGDEFWSASDNFPTNSEQQLMITFSDGNGNITLGRYETLFKTGTNSAETFKISAAQFNTSSWDSDDDGTSNLDELLAGSDPYGATRILLFSETQGYRHDSISSALTVLEELATSADIQTIRADDSTGVFINSNLARYDAVVWVLTSGDVLNASEQTAFEQYIRSGGGYAGIHAASDTEYDWPWYGALVGAYFERHPVIQTATQNVEDNVHASTSHLVSTWTRTDEWYDYSTNPRARVNVLLSLDENSYDGGGMGDDHPSAWYHDYDGGRSWYTGGGHTIESYTEPDFRAHLLGGLEYAAGRGWQ